MYIHILYLRNEDATLAILWMNLPITTTVAGEWLNSPFSYFIINNSTFIQYLVIITSFFEGSFYVSK